MTLANQLEREHQDIDKGIEAFVSGLAAGEPCPDGLADAMGQLRRHIYFEEELLFPPLQKLTEVQMPDRWVCEARR